MADEYIRKQDAVNLVANTAKIVASFNYQYAIDALLAITPADVTPVVHCRDCARLNRNGYCTRFQNNISGIATSWFMPDDDDFCSYGKHRERSKS